MEIYLPIADLPVNVFLVFAMGLAVGFISGMFGIGGGFLMTPLLNTVIRTAEVEADIFGLNASEEPDGFAEASLLLGEYRKMEPGPVEQFLFFDHPAGRDRIYASMRWKAEHLQK